MEQLTSARDKESTPIYVIKPTDAGYTYRLSAGVETTLNVPSGATRALISGDDYWILCCDNTAALPTGSWTQNNNVVAFDALDVTNVTTLHFIARNDTDISVAFYR